jgi:hypothetical protein
MVKLASLEDGGMTLAVAPAGSPLTLKAMFDEKPLTRITETS